MSLLQILLRTHEAWQRFWPFRGKYAVRHVVSYAARRGLLQPSWFTVRDGFSMYLDPKEYLQRRILCEGVWEEKETDYVRSHLKAGDVFIDVGANIGYFTLLAAILVGDGGRVLSIEPNYLAACRLREHLNRNRVRNVLMEEAACSDSEYSGVLHLDEKSNCAGSSLSNRNATGRGIPVSCLTLDQLIERHQLPRVDLIKIDVEGAELQVLRGMALTLTHFRPVLLMELEPALLKGFGVRMEEVLSYLDCMGYVPSPISGSKNCVFASCLPEETI